MTARHKNYLEENFNIEDRTVEVWNIPDANQEDDLQPILEEIKSRIDEMD